jgi:hypothetical protein
MIVFELHAFCVFVVLLGCGYGGESAESGEGGGPSKCSAFEE